MRLGCLSKFPLPIPVNSPLPRRWYGSSFWHSRSRARARINLFVMLPNYATTIKFKFRLLSLVNWHSSRPQVCIIICGMAAFIAIFFEEEQNSFLSMLWMKQFLLHSNSVQHCNHFQPNRLFYTLIERKFHPKRQFTSASFSQVKNCFSRVSCQKFVLNFLFGTVQFRTLI